MADLSDLTQGLILYSHADDHLSHRIRLALQFKELRFDSRLVDEQYPDLPVLNPYQTLPVLIDRELRLYETRLILDYLDERYRHKRLLADTPAQRAEYRQYAWRIEKDWLRAADRLLHNPQLDATLQAAIRQSLQESLTSLNPLFARYPYFLQDEFGLCDCLLAPLLWRLPQLGITLSPLHDQALLAYCQRLFKQPYFQLSLTPQERTLAPVWTRSPL